MSCTEPFLFHRGGATAGARCGEESREISEGHETSLRTFLLLCSLQCNPAAIKFTAVVFVLNVGLSVHAKYYKTLYTAQTTATQHGEEG